MKDEIVVSVCCLAYNHEKYIREALDSIIEQKTNFKIEIIVHDDRSTDDTRNIIQEYARRYPDIVIPVLQDENQYSKGKHIIQNFIYPLVRGKYIAYLECDDYWSDSSKLQKQVDFLENHLDYEACVHNSEYVNCSTGESKKLNSSNDEYDIEMDKMIDWSCEFQTASIVHRANIAISLGGENGPSFYDIAKGYSDYPLALYMRMLGKVRFFSQLMSVNRHGTEGSWTERVDGNEQKSIDNLKNVNLMLEDFDKCSCHLYSKKVQERIQKNELIILKKQMDYKSIVKNEEYIKLLKSTTSRKKYVCICLLAKMPFLKPIVKKIRKHRL